MQVDDDLTDSLTIVRGCQQPILLVPSGRKWCIPRKKAATQILDCQEQPGANVSQSKTCLQYIMDWCGAKDPTDHLRIRELYGKNCSGMGCTTVEKVLKREPFEFEEVCPWVH